MPFRLVLSRLSLRPWRWQKHVRPKRLWTCTRVPWEPQMLVPRPWGVQWCDCWWKWNCQFAKRFSAEKLRFLEGWWEETVGRHELLQQTAHRLENTRPLLSDTLTSLVGLLCGARKRIQFALRRQDTGPTPLRSPLRCRVIPVYIKEWNQEVLLQRHWVRISARAQAVLSELCHIYPPSP